MSFHFTFAARTAHEARSKLHNAYAPAAIKALVEKAIDAVAEPPSKADCEQASTARQSAGSAAPPQKPLIGIFIEVWGNLADAGDGGTSEIQRFLVKPLFV